MSTTKRMLIVLAIAGVMFLTLLIKDKNIKSWVFLVIQVGCLAFQLIMFKRAKSINKDTMEMLDQIKEFEVKTMKKYYEDKVN